MALSVPIPGNYPGGCSDNELQETIQALSGVVVRSGANINTVLQFVPLVQAGQNEQQHRIVRRSAEESTATSRRALRLSRASFYLSLASMVLAGVAAFFAWEASSSTSRWEARQLPILEQVRDEAVRLRADLREQTKLLDAALKTGAMAAKRGNSPASGRK